MTAPSRPEQLWRRLVHEAGEDEIDRAAGMSVADAEAYLAKAGFDVKAERATAEAFLASLAPDEASGTAPPARARSLAEQVPSKPPLPPTLRGRRSRSVGVWVAAAAAAAAVGTGGYLAFREPPPAHPAPSDLAAAVDLRQRAAASLRDGKADECLKLLDEAKAKDPAGDAAPEVTTLRGQANDALGPKPKR